MPRLGFRRGAASEGHIVEIAQERLRWPNTDLARALANAIAINRRGGESYSRFTNE